MASQSDNDKVIRTAFRGLIREFNAAFDPQARRILDNSMKIALGLHDAQKYGDHGVKGHFAHKAVGQTYGWMLLNNGHIVDYKVNVGRHGQGTVFESMKSYASGRAGEGWFGVVLAEMSVSVDGKAPMFLEVSFEQDVLNSAANEAEKQIVNLFNSL